MESALRFLQNYKGVGGKSSENSVNYSRQDHDGVAFPQVGNQAGGRGSRLRHHTWNKPKCLVSVKGKPLLYHLFDKFPDAYFHIIGDYAYDQLVKYLEINPPSVPFNLIQTKEKDITVAI